VNLLLTLLVQALKKRMWRDMNPPGRMFLPHISSAIALVPSAFTMVWLNLRLSDRATPIDISGHPENWAIAMMSKFKPHTLGFGRGWPATYVIQGDTTTSYTNIFINVFIAAMVILASVVVCEIFVRRHPHIDRAIRKALQFRLITMLIALLSAGVLFWVAFHPKIYNEEQTLLESPGWPEPFLRMDFRGRNADELRQSYYGWNSGFRDFDSNLIDCDALAFDLIVNFSIIAAIAFVCEFMMGRAARALEKQPLDSNGSPPAHTA